MTQMTFEPRRDREQLLNATFGIHNSLCEDFHEVQSRHALQGHASSYLNDAIRCFLVGLFDEGRALAVKARDWLQAAIEQGEIPNYYFHGGTESRRYDELAQCNWLLRSQHDADNLAASVRWRDVYLTEDDDWTNTEIQLTLPLYLEAQAYERVNEIFGQSTIKPPKSLKHIRGEGTMSYVLACARQTHDHSAPELQDALDRFLRRQVRYWLGYGHYTNAARWMKIAFWQTGTDAVSTLLRCYDYLPEFERPAV